MSFMKKGTSMAPVRQVSAKDWGVTKTASTALSIDEIEKLKKADGRK